MLTRNVSLSCIVITLCWLAGVAVVVVDLFLPSNDVGHVGLVLCAFGAALWVRSAFQQVHDREREAFNAGRAMGRAEAAEVQLHAIR